MRRVSLLLFSVLLPTILARGQTYEEIAEAHPGAEVMVVVGSATAYHSPSSRSAIAAHLDDGDAVLAYRSFAGWFAVAQPGVGHLGYIQRVHLRKYVEGPSEAYVGIEPRPRIEEHRELPDYNPYRVHRQIAGIGLGGVMAATLVGSLAMNDDYFATTVIPVVGPFITIIRIENDPYSYYRPGGKPLLIASGVAQSVLLAYYVHSLLGERRFGRTPRLPVTSDLRRSNTRGFLLGAGLYGVAWTLPDLDVDEEAGSGFGITTGYGFNDLVALFLHLNGATIDADAGSDYTLAHVDLGTKFSFRGPQRSARPYLLAAVSGLAARQELGNVDVEVTGAAVSFGGGINFFLSRTVAFDVGLQYSVGKLDEVTVGAESLQLEEDVTSARFNLGLSWYPQR